MNRKGKKRLAVDISEEIHKELKILAHKNYQSITVYVTRALLEQIGRDKGEKAILKIISKELE